MRLSQSLRGLSRDGVQGGLAPARVLSPPPAPYGMVAGFPSERSREESPRGLAPGLLTQTRHAAKTGVCGRGPCKAPAPGSGAGLTVHPRWRTAPGRERAVCV